MTIPRVGPCEAYTTADAVREQPGCRDSPPENTVIADAVLFATNWLYRQLGQQFSGTCTSTVRPTSRTGYGTSVFFSDYATTRGVSGRWGWGECGCGAGSQCTAGGRGIQLGEYPVTDIVEILVDGAIVPIAGYHLEDYRWLIREDGSWPTCQNLDLDTADVGSFSVEFEHGQPAPPEVRTAAAAMACWLAKLWRGDDDACRLNERVTSVQRDGYSMALIRPGDILREDGTTGIKEVDLVIASWNPHRLQARAQIASPDVPRSAVRRT